MRLPPQWRLSKTQIILPQKVQSIALPFKRSFGASLVGRVRKNQPVPQDDDERTNDWQDERDLFLSVLNASTTRRDAKSYLSRFQPPPVQAPDSTINPNDSLPLPLHVALVKIRNPQSLEHGVVSGLAQTLSQLHRLGVISIVVLDCSQDDGLATLSAQRSTSIAQADRLVSAIEKKSGMRARRLDYILGVMPHMDVPESPIPVIGAVGVRQDDILYRTLATGTIPVIPPIAYSTDAQKATDVDSDEVLLALTRQFVGLDDSKNLKVNERLDSQGGEMSSLRIIVDRVIVLDPLGGLPSNTRPSKAHVFVNMEQEYEDIRKELEADFENPTVDYTRLAKGGNIHETSNPNSNEQDNRLSLEKQSELAAYGRHLRNLSLLKNSLSLLPASSSALLTSPWEAATFRPSETSSTADLGVGTRRPKNPLIFNLLTDKPLISSSLPVSRLRTPGGSSNVQTGQATFVKRGMSLTMIPDPRHEVWEPPRADTQCLSLDDPRIDFGRLLNLIEDSFNRPLNVEHFIRRIRNRIAGIIVAGEYEGGALLTWELPHGVPDDGSEESRRRMVPYLDKFAVLKRSQGGGGVADIVFSAMVRSCFPQGVCWRSRKNNPVNKWYFERSLGTLKLLDSPWSMFWTTEGLVEDRQRLFDYEAVCRGVEPSWADQKPAD